MAPAVTHERPRKRRKPKRASAGFFAGEVVQILDLKGLDYRQLREMLRLARESRGEACVDRRWATYSFRDLVAIRAIVDLFGGARAIAAGAQLRLRALRAVCLRLRRFGFSDPLLEVKLTRAGSKIVAQSEGIRFEPASGQLLIDDMYERIEATLREKPRGVLVAFGKERKEMVHAVRAGITAIRSPISIERARR